MSKGAKIVDSAILGMDMRSVVVNGKAYMIMPPTIARIAGAGYYLSAFDEARDVKDIFNSLKDINNAAKALSWFINGDESLSEELSQGTLEEVILALETAYSLISVENFSRLSALTRNVSSLTARQRR